MLLVFNKIRTANGPFLATHLGPVQKSEDCLISIEAAPEQLDAQRKITGSLEAERAIRLGLEGYFLSTAILLTGT